MTTLWHDLRYSLRLLAKSPGFAAVALVSLALGMGANTAIFSLINATLLRPLPVRDPERLVTVYTSDYSGPARGSTSYPDYLDIREQAQVFSGFAAFSATPMSLSDEGRTERILGQVVTGDYFNVLGVDAALGRTFVPEEDRTPGTHPVVVISHGLWQRVLGGDPGVVGRRIVVNGTAFTIIGVTPPAFTGAILGVAPDVYLPIMMVDQLAQAPPGNSRLAQRGSRGMFTLGRLAPGVTREQAQAAMDTLAAQLHAAYPREWTDRRQQPRRLTVESQQRAIVFPQFRGGLVGLLSLLAVVVGLVLLIACANLANLLLARASARRREIGVRLALGAGRRRLVRQLLTESLLLAVAGGALGVLVAEWTIDMLMKLQPPTPIPMFLDLSLDYRALAFTALLALVTGVLFGLVPALRATRPGVIPALKGDAPITSRLGFSTSRVLVVSQVGLSLLLLVGSGLFVRSLGNAGNIDTGFDANNLLVMSMDLRLQGYDDVRTKTFCRQLLERVSGLPGVISASLADSLPLSLHGQRTSVRMEGYAPQPGEDMEINFAKVAPRYFETMRIALRRGREFTPQDREGAPGVAVVNEAFARRYWPGQDPLGKKVRRGPAEFTVIGLARDGKYRTLGEDPLPFLYFPLDQVYSTSVTLHVRTAGDPAALLGSVRREIQSLDRDLPLYEVKTMRDHLGIAMLPARLAASLLGGFGVLALALAAIGIYGVMSYSVAQRTREIGIRMALGADRRRVLNLVVGQGMLPALIGAILGLAAAVGVTRFAAGFLYGISATDILTFAGVTGLLAAVALAASYLPARRATRVDPVVALRYE
jgi:predicted permease